MACRECGARSEAAKGLCLAHATPKARDALLASLADPATTQLPSFRGVHFTPELLARLLDALPVETGGPIWRHADFRECRFDGDLDLSDSSFQGTATFDGCHFSGIVRLEATSFDELLLTRCRFDGQVFAGGLDGQALDLSRSEFAADLNLGGSSIVRVEARRTTFVGFTDMENVGWDVVDLTESKVGSIRISGSGRHTVLRDCLLKGTVRVTATQTLDAAGAEFRGPSILTVRGDVDLSGAALGADVRLLADGTSARLTSMAGAVVSRPVHVDEQVSLKTTDFHRAMGVELLVASLSSLEVARNPTRSVVLGHTATGPLDPSERFRLCRALRVGAEERRDFELANALRLSEMDARSASASSRSERVLLWLYRAVSVYGLSIRRPLALLVALVVVGAVVLEWFGFEHCAASCTSAGDGGLFVAMRSGVALTRTIPSDLTRVGRWTVAILEVIGPLHVAVTGLAVRSRLRR